EAEHPERSDYDETDETLAVQMVDALQQKLVELFLRDIPGVERAVDGASVRRIRLGIVRAGVDDGAQRLKIDVCMPRKGCNCGIDKLPQPAIRISALSGPEIVRYPVHVCAQQGVERCEPRLGVHRIALRRLCLC